MIGEPLSGSQLSGVLSTVINSVMDNSARSAQKDAGLLGFSDLGFCENKAVLVTKQTPPSDPRKKLWAAVVGQGVHDVVERAFAEVFTDWLIEYGKDDGNEKLVAKFPNGAEMAGTPDCISQKWNAIIELKTKDGFVRVKREGVSRNHRFQTYAGALAALQRGVLDSSRPVHLYWVYLDRSGNDSDPWVEHEVYDDTVIDEVNQWISNVIYARTNDEDGMREIPASICADICEHFGNCRGGALPMGDSQLFTDEEVLASVEMHLEGQQLEKDGKALKREARKTLEGLNGSTGQYQIRTTYIGPSEVAATHKNGYDKLEVFPIRKAAK